MAKGKANRIIVKLVSEALTGYFYTTSRNRNLPALRLIKYDPVVRRHVVFKESRKTK